MVQDSLTDQWIVYTVHKLIEFCILQNAFQHPIHNDSFEFINDTEI